MKLFNYILFSFIVLATAIAQSPLPVRWLPGTGYVTEPLSPTLAFPDGGFRIGTTTPATVTGNAGSFSLTAQGSNQPIVFSASGTGDFRFNTAATVGQNFLIGTATDTGGRLQVLDAAAAQLALYFDASNSASMTVGATGILTFDMTGSSQSVVVSDVMGIGSAANASNSLTVANATANGVGIRVSQNATVGTAYGMSVTANGASTQNIAGFFEATGAATNIALSTGNGIVVIGDSTPSTSTTTGALTVGSVGVNGALNAKAIASPWVTVATLGVGATTFAITSNNSLITGDAGGNTISTITGGTNGMIAVLKFTNAVTISDTDANTANTVDLPADFVAGARDTLTIICDGTKWFGLSSSAN